MRRTSRLLVGMVALIGLIAGIGALASRRAAAPEPRPPLALAPGEAARIDAAVRRADAFLGTVDVREPYGFLAMDFLARRYGLRSFERPLERFEAFVAGLHDPGNRAGAALWRRVSDRATPYDAQVMRDVPPIADRLTLPALYCDLAPLDAAWRRRALDALAGDEYERTHVLYAVMLARDLDCPPPLTDEVMERAYAEAARISERRPPDDVAIEAAAFLQQMGEGQRVRPEFVTVVLDAQHEDGGWSWQAAPDEKGNWHSTTLAVWFLLERRGVTPLDGVVAHEEGRAPWTRR